MMLDKNANDDAKNECLKIAVPASFYYNILAVHNATNYAARDFKK